MRSMDVSATSVDGHECSNLNPGSELFVSGVVKHPAIDREFPVDFASRLSLGGTRNLRTPPSYIFLCELTSIDPNDLKNNGWMVRISARTPESLFILPNTLQLSAVDV